MKRFTARVTPIFAVSIIAMSVLWLGSGAAVGGQAGPGRGEAGDRRPHGIVADQFIVVFHDTVANPRDLANALGQSHGFTARRTYQYALKGFAARMPASVAQALARDPDVAYVEPDVRAYANAQTTPTGVLRIGANTAPAVACDSVDVAIIDTGIDLDHPDLNVVAGRNFNAANNVGDGNDDNGHGTHVAGIVGAKNDENGVVGVCPGARLWAVKVLDSTGSGFFSDIIEGVDYVTVNAKQIKVANMSLAGIGYLASFRTAIQNSVNAGVVYVVAAGNNAIDVYGANGRLDTASDYNAFLCAFLGVSCGDDVMPAAYPEAMTISAMNDTDGQPGGIGPAPSTASYGADDSFAGFSNFSNSVVAGNPVTSPGLAIDLMLPGVDILSTWPGGGLALGSGTSMASPHAAGLAARYIVANPNSRPTNSVGVYAIRQALINNGVAQDSANGLNTRNDPDGDWEKIGWAGTPPAPLPAITISDVSVAEGNSGPTDAVFTVTLSAPSTQMVTVNFTTADGTATTANGDYVAKSGTLTFSPGGALSQTIAVTINGDTAVEANETFNVNLTSATNAYIADNQGVGTITNDETVTPLEVFFDSFEVAEWNGLWTEDGQNDWFRSNQRATNGTFSAEVDGSASNAQLISVPINLQGRTNATITFSWLIESSLDSGEYIAFDVSTNGGSSWVEKARLRGNVSQENTWHNVTVTVNAINNLRLRFRGNMNQSDEDANVDNVKVVAF